MQDWKQYLPEFREKTAAFYAGEMTKGDYKKFSGFYGSYAQRSGEVSMLRLRLTAGCVRKDKLAAIAGIIRKYGIKKVHFTTCQTIQLHDLKPEIVADVIESAIDAGFVTIGGGGDYPRNVMCSPLSGVEKGEYFDVSPWAQAAGNYMISLITAEKMPRKLKVGFSNSPANTSHVTYRDLGFAANEDGTFDVYSAGGLGNNARFGVKVAEGIEPGMILYYIKAMWLTFRAYGNYENRGRARTRYMQDTLGGPEKYAEAFRGKLKEVMDSGEELWVQAESKPIEKSGDGGTITAHRVTEQKQEGLYTVSWHPIGGQPPVDELLALADALAGMEDAELRLSPDETAYIVNLTSKEAKKVLSITKSSAVTRFETTVSCIGAGICQIGLRDSQKLLRSCVEAAREAGLPDGVLPQMHISGCPSSCGTHQTGEIGFRGAVKKVDGKPQSAFMLFVNGSEYQGKERMGEELGAILEADIPKFIVKLGKHVAAQGISYAEWKEKNPDGVRELAAEYLDENL